MGRAERGGGKERGSASGPWRGAAFRGRPRLRSHWCGAPIQSRGSPPSVGAGVKGRTPAPRGRSTALLALPAVLGGAPARGAPGSTRDWGPFSFSRFGSLEAAAPA
ncbi:MAG: hypothetical protein QXJ59_06645, partial [Thermofilaceae archaeon]